MMEQRTRDRVRGLALVCLGLALPWLAQAGASSAALQRKADANPVDRYNVVWNSPSQGSMGSMPLGNGDIGLNVWAEPDGDLVFYVSKTDAWSDIVRLLKVGRVRVRFTPNPFTDGQPFRQTLCLREGAIEIRAGRAHPITARLWVDAEQPVVRADAESEEPFRMEVALDLWRDRPMVYTNAQDVFSAWQVIGRPEEAADTVWPTAGDRLVWFHRNVRKPGETVWAQTLTSQQLTNFVARATDPLLNRTFGGRLEGAGFVKQGDRTLVSAAPARRHRVTLVALTQQTPTPEAYVAALGTLAERIARLDPERCWRAHTDWWKAFWQRSWVRVTLPPSANERRHQIEPSGLPLRIGADSAGGNRLVGGLDGVQVWARALTSAEIAAHAAGGKPVPDAACVAGWDFDQSPAASNLVSQVGAGLTARAVGVVAFREGRAGQGLWLDGGGFMESPPAASLALTEALTIECWVRPVTNAAGRLVDTSRAGSSQGYCLDLYPALTPRAILAPSTLTAPPLVADAWSHVATTFDAQSGEHRLYVNGREAASAYFPPHDRDLVGRAYALQRFLFGCAGRGAFPIKFNGSLFTFDMPEIWGAPDPQHPWMAHADYRRWGGGYWFQNTRLTYWGMLAAGDYASMQPFFRMYLDALSLGRERTRQYYLHAGAIFPETTWFWGGYQIGDSYGPNPGELRNPWTRNYLCGNLELLAMMFDYVRHTGDTAFLRQNVLPAADDILTFYEGHYPRRDAQGRMLFDPSQALETWQKAVNPANEIAGLMWVLDSLLALPETVLEPAARDRWRAYRARLPPLPIRRDESGVAWIAPAEEILDIKRNNENPELYAIFPFRLYGVGKPDLELARETFERRLHKWGGGWSQNEIHGACLGLAAEVAPRLVTRFTPSRTYRFPAFWGPNMDWVPDQDHGGSGIIALQAMLMQCDGGRIRLFPAWPKEWDVEFKLHAPEQTTVEGVYRGGRLERLKVTPRSRTADVEVLDPQSLSVPVSARSPFRMGSDAEFVPIDLAAVANRGLADEVADDGRGGWTDQGAAHDMRLVAPGRRVLAGVPFQVGVGPRSIVVLRSTSRPAGDLPETVEIPMGLQAQALYFLHAAAYADKGSFFRYVVCYADGAELPVNVDETNLRDWAAETAVRFVSETGTVSTLAETVSSPGFGQGSTYVMEWCAPAARRGVAIRSIRFEGNTKAVPVLLGITARMAGGTPAHSPFSAPAKSAGPNQRNQRGHVSAAISGVTSNQRGHVSQSAGSRLDIRQMNDCVVRAGCGK